MVTLKPPFRAEDMEGLYKKVIRGNILIIHEISMIIITIDIGYYPKIPAHFSQDLNNILRALL